MVFSRQSKFKSGRGNSKIRLVSGHNVQNFHLGGSSKIIDVFPWIPRGQAAIGTATILGTTMRSAMTSSTVSRTKLWRLGISSVPVKGMGCKQSTWQRFQATVFIGEMIPSEECNNMIRFMFHTGRVLFVFHTYHFTLESVLQMFLHSKSPKWKCLSQF